jgi:hypothetical protein
MMTKSRNLKAAIHAFAASRKVSYTEARRLMGIDSPELTFTDVETQARVHALLKQNSVKLEIFYPDGGVYNNEAGVYRLLDVDYYDRPMEDRRFNSSLLDVKSWIMPEEHILERVRVWLRGHVSNPWLMPPVTPEGDKQYRRVLDQADALIDWDAGTVKTYLYRMPSAPVNLDSMDVTEAFQWQKDRRGTAHDAFLAEIGSGIDLSWGNRMQFRDEPTSVAPEESLAQVIARLRERVITSYTPGGESYEAARKTKVEDLVWDAGTEHHINEVVFHPLPVKLKQ